MRVLVIEDEPLAQEELVRLVHKLFPEMDIVAILSSVSESIEWLTIHSADLIFMDIHLADGLSFDIFSQVDLETPIIFTTAYDQYAVQAFQVNGVGYLLKPIVEKDLICAVDKLNHKAYAPLNLNRLLQSMNMPKEYKSRIGVKIGDRYNYVEIARVAYFYVEERVTFIMTIEGKRYIVDYSIEALESLLDPKQFFRISRGCIASIGSIKEVTRHFNSRLKVTLTPPYDGDMLISRVRVSEFLRWLDGQ